MSSHNSFNEPIPEPLAAKQYSGKFVVRVPSELHRELTIEARGACVVESVCQCQIGQPECGDQETCVSKRAIFFSR